VYMENALEVILKDLSEIRVVHSSCAGVYSPAGAADGNEMVQASPGDSVKRPCARAGL
jgi:hypothetical protein